MNYQHLSEEERYTITALLKTGLSQAAVARKIGRNKSTISRELARNRRPTGYYTAPVAQSYATARRKRSRRGSNFTKEQWRIVLDLIEDDYSPEQASNIIKEYFGFSISHETIYLYLLYDKKKGGTLFKHLRIVPKRRRKRYNSHDSRGVLPGKRMIADRPLEIDSRASLGHWEGDTVMGKDRHHCIVTLVERKTGFLIIKKVKARTTLQVNAACVAAIREHGKKFVSITFDNGTEFHAYKELEYLFPVTCYFANPYHSWERGTNENTNGLIRQYLPIGSCMKRVTQTECDRIAYKLNTRPRKRLGYKTPFELFYNVASPLHFKLEFKSLPFYTMCCTITTFLQWKGQNMGTLRNQMIDYMVAHGYSDKTIKLYTCCIKCFSYHYMKSPLTISYQEIESFFLYLRKQKKSESTIHIYYEALKFFYSVYNLKERIPYFNFSHCNNRLPTILCQNEVFHLLEQCTSLKYRTIFTLIYSAGLRISEAAQLKLSDIDFNRKQILVRNGKNKKDRYTLLANETILLLKQYMQIYNPVDYVFYSNDIAKSISVDCIQQYFKKLLSECNIKKPIHVHTLRHCFATHLLENGISIFYIMHLLGHSNIQTTMIYLHIQSFENLNIVSPMDNHHFSSMQTPAIVGHQMLLQSA